jgi:hypothetical protein
VRRALADARTRLRALDGRVGSALARRGLPPAAQREAQALRARVAAADAAVAGVERRLAALQTEVDAALGTLGNDVAGQLAAVRQPLEQALDAAGAVLAGAREQLATVTGGVMGALDAVGAAITAIRDTGDGLLQTLDTAVATGVSALGAIPVDALPPMMVATARSALTQATTAAGTALSTAAQAASQQLAPIGGQIGGQIDGARAAASSAIQQGVTTLLAGITAARTQAEAAAAPIATQIDALITALETQLDAQLTGLETTVRGLAEPVLAHAATVTAEVGAAVDALVGPS